MPKVISIDSDVLGGTPVFAGTCVPVVALFECLGAGETIDDFLEGFPSVTKEQALALLEDAAGALLETAR